MDLALNSPTWGLIGAPWSKKKVEAKTQAKTEAKTAATVAA